ncbi:unnamed protein product [Amoebophrya sp. A120]|nr:unnamed protein product [Amoebophrya sp. A120]|eukprot:GSA120T00023271001.1
MSSYTDLYDRERSCQRSGSRCKHPTLDKKVKAKRSQSAPRCGQRGRAGLMALSAGAAKVSLVDAYEPPKKNFRGGRDEDDSVLGLNADGDAEAAKPESSQATDEIIEEISHDDISSSSYVSTHVLGRSWRCAYKRGDAGKGCLPVTRFTRVANEEEPAFGGNGQDCCVENEWGGGFKTCTARDFTMYDNRRREGCERAYGGWVPALLNPLAYIPNRHQIVPR